MKVGPYIGWTILVLVFASAMLGMLLRQKLPKSDLDDETKGVVTLSMGVVGTLTALVLSLLIATASGTFNTRNQEITLLAAKVIQLDRLLRRPKDMLMGEPILESLDLDNVSVKARRLRGTAWEN